MVVDIVPVRRPLYLGSGRRGGRRGGQRGGIGVGAILSGLSTANQIAKTVKPATILGNILDATGASKGKVGRVFRNIASVGQSLGYGKRRRRRRRKGSGTTSGGRHRRQRR